MSSEKRTHSSTNWTRSVIRPRSPTPVRGWQVLLGEWLVVCLVMGRMGEGRKGKGGVDVQRCTDVDHGGGAEEIEDDFTDDGEDGGFVWV